MFVTEYFLNSAFYVLSKEGYLSYKFTDEKHILNLTTDILSIIVGNNIFKYFDSGMPCIFTLATVDPPPTIKLYSNVSTITANTTLDFFCQKNANDTNFY